MRPQQGHLSASRLMNKGFDGQRVSSSCQDIESTRFDEPLRFKLHGSGRRVSAVSGASESTTVDRDVAAASLSTTIDVEMSRTTDF